MDQSKIGRFIAEQRKANHMTQQELGEKVGVTNKTVSRWENGNYMPDIEMIQILSDIFHVSINEILAGQRLNDEEFRKVADENVFEISRQSAFSFPERKQYFIQKWRKEHIYLFVTMAVIDILFVLWCNMTDQKDLIAFVGIIILVEYCYQNNRMMIYVENHLYGNDGKGNLLK